VGEVALALASFLEHARAFGLAVEEEVEPADQRTALERRRSGSLYSSRRHNSNNHHLAASTSGSSRGGGGGGGSSPRRRLAAGKKMPSSPAKYAGRSMRAAALRVTSYAE
jgi:hypothetical protein